MGMSEGRQCRIARIRAVADDLPSKPGADLSQGVWLSVPKHDEVLRVEGDHKISIVALKCHQPSRMHHARGQRTLSEMPTATSKKNLSVCRVTPRLLKCRLHNPEGVTPWEMKGHVHILTWSVRASALERCAPPVAALGADEPVRSPASSEPRSPPPATGCQSPSR